MVIWITGLSASGKTTLCGSLVKLLKSKVPELVVLDGDVVRSAFGHNLGHNVEDRVLQVQRLQSMARVLSAQGLLVLVGVLYAREDLLVWNRNNLPNYFEIYLRASMSTVRARDPKGLYAAADRGEISDVVGVHIPWNEPQFADMIVDQDAGVPPDILARLIAERIPRLRNALTA